MLSYKRAPSVQDESRRAGGKIVTLSAAEIQRVFDLVQDPAVDANRLHICDFIRTKSDALLSAFQLENAPASTPTRESARS